MEAIKRLSGIYMIGVAIAVAVYFIINPFLVDSFEVIKRLARLERPNGHWSVTGANFQLRPEAGRGCAGPKPTRNPAAPGR